MSGNPFTFTAREDDGTGLMYYRARYYDPALQVFISQDPLGDDQRYVGGNPTGFTDPLGLGPKGAVYGASIGGAAGTVIGGTLGGVSGGTTGTFFAPGVGTIGGAVYGTVDGGIKGGAFGAIAGGAIGSIVEDCGTSVSCAFLLSTAKIAYEVTKLNTSSDLQKQQDYSYNVTLTGGDSLAQFMYECLTGVPAFPMVQLPSVYPPLPGNVQYRDRSKFGYPKVDIHNINTLQQHIKFTFR